MQQQGTIVGIDLKGKLEDIVIMSFEGIHDFNMKHGFILQCGCVQEEITTAGLDDFKKIMPGTQLEILSSRGTTTQSILLQVQGIKKVLNRQQALICKIVTGGEYEIRNGSPIKILN